MTPIRPGTASTVTISRDLFVGIVAMLVSGLLQDVKDWTGWAPLGLAVAFANCVGLVYLASAAFATRRNLPPR